MTNLDHIFKKQRHHFAYKHPYRTLWPFQSHTDVRIGPSRRLRAKDIKHRNTLQTPNKSLFICIHNYQGKGRTQSPTTPSYAVELPTFGQVAGVSTPRVQWISLALGKPPS